MIHSAEMEEFLREGLLRYAGAWETVDTFEGEVKERLVQRVLAKGDWINFRPVLKGGAATASSNRADGAWGISISASQESADEEGAWLEIGLWWRSSRARNGVLAYAQYWPKRGMPDICLTDPRPPVVCASIEKKPRLFVVVEPPSADLDHLFRLLLDEMDRALAGRGGR